MKGTINKQILVGNLGKDPRITRTGDTVIANISIATTGRDDSTTWHNVVAFNKTAEFAEKYLKKGAKVYVEGPTQNRTYEKDGETKYVTEVVANVLQSLSRAKDDGDEI